MTVYFFVVASSPRRVVSLQRTSLPVYRDLGTGSVVSARPSPGPSLALGVGRVTVHLCPRLHVFFIPTVPAQIPRCKMDTTHILQILGQREFFFVLIKYWQRNHQKVHSQIILCF